MAVLRYHWPEDEMNPDGSLKESGNRMVGAGDTLYMSDQLGLHKVREITLALNQPVACWFQKSWSWFLKTS
jgi:hypothetical protein